MSAPTFPDPMPSAPDRAPDGLRDALLDNRRRWPELVAAGADFAFETDAAGRFAFVWPDPALGWAAEALIGRPADALLAPATAGEGPTPFRPDAPARDRLAWLTRADGSRACFRLAVAPIRDAEGRILGARGVAADLSGQDARDAAMAAALRRGEVIDHILRRMRQEVLAPRMMQAVLDSLTDALGAQGAAVIDTLREDPDRAPLHVVGAGADTALAGAAALIRATGEAPGSGIGADGQPLLAASACTRFGERVGLVLWREARARPWNGEDATLLASAAGIVRVVLEHESIQREMARQARTDTLTGLLNRRAFLDEAARRIDRLDRESLPGTLLFIDLDNLKPLNDRWGHEIGDEALRRTAALLRDAVRPADLVARLGGDEFAVWMDGADGYTAAERAESLRQAAPRALGDVLPDPAYAPVSMSIGIAVREAAGGEDLDSLTRRADLAMYEAKRAGRGQWRVSRQEPV